jgi:ribose transport system substrate-binding protein
MIDRRTMVAGGMALLGGCAKTASVNGHRPRIALIMKSLANEFFVTMAKGAEKFHKENSSRFDLLINGTRNESDLAQQVGIVDQMIAMGVDAIVIAPADSKAIVPAAVRAKQAGIVVINIDNRLDRRALNDYQTQFPFVGPDDRMAARRVGTVLAQTLKAGDEVAILEGISTADNSKQRRMGLEDAAKAAKLNIVTMQSANWDQAQAASISSAILLRHANLRGIMCANDSMALGAASAVEQARRQQSVKVTGFDNLEAIRPLVERGTVIATADQHGALLAVYGIEYALEMRGGQTRLADRSTQVDLVTAGTLATNGPGQ